MSTGTARITALIALLLLGTSAFARDNWRQIGEVRYENPFQRAVIDVGADDGRLEALRLQVQGPEVEIDSMRIVYGNKETEDLAVHQKVRTGAISQPIPLRRGTRYVRQVVVSYRAFGPAQFALQGDVAAEPQAAWEQLGCKPVDFGIDRDVIRVGRDEGRYNQLMLSVEENPVEFYEVRVVYGNGEQQSLPFRAVLRPQQDAQPLQLAGHRGINRIEIVYRSLNQQRGRAVVCAHGLRTDERVSRR